MKLYYDYEPGSPSIPIDSIDPVKSALWISPWLSHPDFISFCLKQPDAMGTCYELLVLLRPARAVFIGCIRGKAPGEDFPEWISKLPKALFNMYDYPSGHKGPVYVNVRLADNSEYQAEIISTEPDPT
jgi:hypothetical protein